MPYHEKGFEYHIREILGGASPINCIQLADLGQHRTRRGELCAQTVQPGQAAGVLRRRQVLQ